ncbi:hypothetical protein [Reichenbachiella versicolor]|uniref:hypothetical protein n=1 Tax=Reichenbachiella versicolor TaxID=1821036 RepID=UPI000D6EA646|nr:hypothetical protein [Reichenbachiella versicolor]
MSFPDLSLIIFQYCQINIEAEGSEVEGYYEFLDSFRGLTFSELVEKLEGLGIDDVTSWMNFHVFVP